MVKDRLGQRIVNDGTDNAVLPSQAEFDSYVLKQKNNQCFVVHEAVKLLIPHVAGMQRQMMSFVTDISQIQNELSTMLNFRIDAMQH